MNFERLNDSFKRPTHIMNNFRNPLLTLAYKRQCASLEARLATDFLADCVEISSSTETNISQFPNMDFEPYLSTDSQTTVRLTDCVTVNGTLFKKSYFVIVERDDQGYAFGNIDTIVCDNPLRPVFLLNLFDTKYFDNHLYCYCIERKLTAETRFCLVENLLDFHPLDSFEKLGESYIRLKYKVF